ncbi:MAG: hypothetical protein M3268_09725 [Acidobacteriota bacterium]|nr:hypothetical protein [Acidobacteriota bacterium]
MRFRLLTLVLFAALAAVALPQIAAKFNAAGATARAAVRDSAQDRDRSRRDGDDNDFTERDESRQSYALAPGASVEINSVSGNLTVETAEVSEAQVEIVRTARTREDLRCRQFKIEADTSRLHIDGNDDRRECRNVQVRQTVNMRVPRRISFSANSVAGRVRVGEIDGAVGLSSIAGNATVALASGEATFSSIAGNVTVNLSRLGSGGVRMNSVAGNIDVGLPVGANADFTVRSITGEVIADTPDVFVRKVSSDSFEGRVGAGGAEMIFNSIAGNVRFHRAGE